VEAAGARHTIRFHWIKGHAGDRFNERCDLLARQQALAQQYSESENGYIVICGRYEGYDDRIMALVDQGLSIGDYVLTGGELPAMTIIDSIVRLIPGVLGGENSAAIESFSDGETLEYPQYTRPEEWQGLRVPEVLLSGHHGKIAEWRAAHSKKAGE